MTAADLLESIVGWLRKGYPQGIPPADFPPLLALLQRSLRPEEVADIVARVITENPDGDITADSVARAVAQVKEAPPNEEDITEVAARLAAVGWPLAVPEGRPQEPAGSTGPNRPSALQNVIGWLRAGYPQGVPPIDYLPILALLHRRLTDDEVQQVAQTLMAEQSRGGEPSIARADAHALISGIVQGDPSAADIDRVRAVLVRHGWPLQGDSRAPQPACLNTP